MLTCQHCGSKGRIMVQTVITAPSDLYRQFSKKNLRSKDVQTHGTLWETCDFICGNEECGRVTNGYGNYVTNLEKENEQIKEALKGWTFEADGEWLRITKPNGALSEWSHRPTTNGSGLYDLGMALARRSI